jgi:hypothetical protein
MVGGLTGLRKLLLTRRGQQRRRGYSPLNYAPAANSLPIRSIEAIQSAIRIVPVMEALATVHATLSVLAKCAIEPVSACQRKDRADKRQQQVGIYLFCDPGAEWGGRDTADQQA